MSPRTLSITTLVYAALSAFFRGQSLSVPVFKVPFLGGAWLGWIMLALVALTGGWLLWRRAAWDLEPAHLEAGLPLP